ncbi:hypothetical protein [Prescottella equi]|uniref:hypothetical protein n=1 Tax=Rhodococcus hoagii TaxID=43767 RepID=UPI00111C1CAB|nr:hypothetical protein [Prescottella equi]
MHTLLTDPRTGVYVPELRGEAGRIMELWAPLGSPEWFVDSLADRYKVPVSTGSPDPAEYRDLPLPTVPVVGQAERITVAAAAVPELARVLTQLAQENRS